MKTLALMLIVCALLAGSGAHASIWSEYEYDESCTFCAELEAEWRKDSPPLTGIPESFGLPLVLELLTEKLDLAIHLAAAASFPLVERTEVLKEYLDQLLEIMIYAEPGDVAIRLDTVTFLLGIANSIYPYVPPSIQDGKSGQYNDAYDAADELIFSAGMSMLACRDSLENGDKDGAFDSMRQAYALLLAARGNAGEGLIPGLRSMCNAVVSSVVTVPLGESIQRAVDSIAAGGTVQLLPGIYSEHLVIDKDVTIRGATVSRGGEWTMVSPVTVIESPSPSTLLHVGEQADAQAKRAVDEAILGPEVEIESVELRGGGFAAEVADGAILTAVDCVIRDSRFGIGVGEGGCLEASELLVTGSRRALQLGGTALLSGCAFEGNTGDEPGFCGVILARKGSKLEMRACSISNNATHGLILIEPASVMLWRNHIVGFFAGGDAGDSIACFMDSETLPESVSGCGNEIELMEDCTDEEADWAPAYEYLMAPCRWEDGG